MTAPNDLPARLQAALGDAYRVEKELGGGGMSRVFLAEEVRLGRKFTIGSPESDIFVADVAGRP